MGGKFQVKKRPSPIRSLLFVVVLGAFVAFFELYRWIVPFLPKNPLYHEATVGETVIGDWKYGGKDEEGYLKFINSHDSQPALFPPTEHTIDLDGQFVVLENATNGTITFADPIEAIPTRWLGIILAIMATGFLSFAWVWRKRRKLVRFRTSQGLATQKPSKRFAKSTRFRPK